VAELAAAHAVERDLLRDPHVRDDGEAETDEMRRLMGERAERDVTQLARAIRERGDEGHTGALPAAGFVDDQRADFRHLGAERRELAAADDAIVRDRHDEAARMRLDVVERPR
jgi:hypothetical protein